MKVNLPILNGVEPNTLYIIGNGFDLYHGLKTKYKHFYSWLILNDKEHFVNDMENIFQFPSPHGNLLWQDFEAILGEYDIDVIHRLFSGKKSNPIYDEDYQNRAAQRFCEIVSNIPLYLREWIGSVDINNVKPKLPLSSKSWYLTFNYTLMLEKVYAIPDNHICHIHNSIAEQKSLITGHKNYFSMNGIDLHDFNYEKSLEKIASEVNKLYKPVDNQIEIHKDFFTGLTHISHVVVVGHSLSNIDMPYITKVFHHVQDNTKWYFVVYDDIAENVCFRTIDGFARRVQCVGECRFKNKMNPENCKIIKINSTN